MTAWVVVPCARGRVEELRGLLEALDCPPQRTVVVTTEPDPIHKRDISDLSDHLLYSPHVMHFGEWLNYGFDYIALQVELVDWPATDVLCIGSSVKVTGPIVEPLRAALGFHDVHMVGPDLHGYQTRILPDERNVYDRVPGVCFMVNLGDGLRFDPQFRWWYSDDDLEMQARQLGPVAVVGGLPVSYDPVHKLTDEQEAFATEDYARFCMKWGKAPH